MKKGLLKRRGGWIGFNDHICGWRIVAVYIFFKRKWVKIGEYCQGCGAIALYPKFAKGIEHKELMRREMVAGRPPGSIKKLLDNL